jgi:protein-S-isoprenylcysteine O-methyltransferase Ste14
MYLFLIPLVTGFIFNATSALTAVFSRRWGERWGSRISFIFRNILGIPLWALGLALAVRTKSSKWFTPAPAIIVSGWALITAGCGIILWGLKSIRWRAVKPSMHDELVQDGIYAYIRHPLHAGTFLEIVGL